MQKKLSIIIFVLIAVVIGLALLFGQKKDNLGVLIADLDKDLASFRSNLEIWQEFYLTADDAASELSSESQELSGELEEFSKTLEEYQNELKAIEELKVE